ncbi:MAG: hypothetical protein WAO10_20570, partial [Candidatus Sulfotelmatobacter sp.]
AKQGSGQLIVLRLPLRSLRLFFATFAVKGFLGRPPGTFPLQELHPFHHRFLTHIIALDRLC